MDNTSEKNNTSEKKSFIKKILNKINLEGIKSFFWKNKIRKIITSSLISFCIIFFIIIYFKSFSFLSKNPYIDDSGLLSSANETAEIILLIGERNIKNGNYEEALFGSDSIYNLPKFTYTLSNGKSINIKGNSIKFPGLIAFNSDPKISKTPSSDEANYWIGVCYFKLAESTEDSEEKVKNYTEAIGYLEKETNSETFNSFRHSQVGDIFFQLGDKEKALKYYQESLDKDEDKNPIIRLEILYKSAELAKILEKYDLAIEYYKNISIEFPKSQYAGEANKKIAEILAKK